MGRFTKVLALFIATGIALAWLANHPAQASGLIQSAYNLIQNGGTPVTREPTLNFVNGGCVDNSGAHSTDCTISGGGSAGAGVTVFSGSAVTLLGTQFVAIGGGAAISSTEASVELQSPAVATISNLSVQLSAALGTGASAVFTWRDGGSSQTLTCTIAGATATTCQDITHSFSAAQGDELDIQVVTTGIPAAGTLVIATQFGIALPGIQKYTQSFSSVTSVVLTDNLNTVVKTTQCYDSASPPNLIEPQNIAITDANDVTVTFSSSQSGSCIVQG